MDFNKQTDRPGFLDQLLNKSRYKPGSEFSGHKDFPVLAVVMFKDTRRPLRPLQTLFVNRLGKLQGPLLC